MRNSLLLLIILFAFNQAFAQSSNKKVYYSTKSGNWNSKHIWSASPTAKVPVSKAPRANDNVVIRHKVAHNPKKTYNHYGNIEIAHKGQYLVNTGKGSKHPYVFQGNSFIVRGKLTTTGDFHHQKFGSHKPGIFIIEGGASIDIGDDLILNGQGELFINDTCSQAVTTDDIYFKGTGGRICGTGSIIVSDKIRVWNDKNEELTKKSPDAAFQQVKLQVCPGFKFYKNLSDCHNANSPLVEGGIVLPISLLEFSANEEIEGINLSWATIRENNNAFFTLERSANAAEFQELEHYPGAGNSDETQHYSLMDKQPLIGKNFYRLKYTDFDGNVAYSGVIEVFVGSVKSEMAVYPNPSAHAPQLRLNGFTPEMPGELAVRDLTGRVLYQQRFTVDAAGAAEMKIEQNMSAGIYFITAMVDGQKPITSRFVKL